MARRSKGIFIIYYYFHISFQEDDVGPSPCLRASLRGKPTLRLGLKQAIFGNSPQILCKCPSRLAISPVVARSMNCPFNSLSSLSWLPVPSSLWLTGKKERLWPLGYVLIGFPMAWLTHSLTVLNKVYPHKMPLLNLRSSCCPHTTHARGQWETRFPFPLSDSEIP